MKKLNEKIKDLKILLAQNNEITTKTKFLLKQTPADFLNKFFENKIEDGEILEIDSERIFPCPARIIDNNGKSFQAHVNLGDLNFKSLELVFFAENPVEQEEIKIDIYDDENIDKKPKLNKLIDTSCSEIDKANLTTKNISIEHIIRKEHKNYSSRKLTFLELFSNQQNDDVLVTVSETSKYLNSKQTETKKTDISINLINEKTKD